MANKQWVWIAIDVKGRQIIAFYVGDRSRESARKLWQSIPEIYREKATFYTDDWQAYKGVIPDKQHRVVSKQSLHKNNHIERFNCTLRQRVSRLVRKALSFSKKLYNHIGAIKYFICEYPSQNPFTLPYTTLSRKTYPSQPFLRRISERRPRKLKNSPTVLDV